MPEAPKKFTQMYGKGKTCHDVWCQDEFCGAGEDPTRTRGRSRTVKVRTAKVIIEEVKMLLGWLYDIRRLLIALPVDKYINWSNDIKTIRKEK